ncbi:MAG: UDP-N-acetylmuramate dehydrogenase [Candidatus Dojkabacteria bacterium]|nr:UDP-N-acetylmuramate dehydrogenase [Candidatus Dojkabacteria bacterium]
MKISKNKSLKNLNQYGVDANAKIFVELEDLNDIQELENSKILDNEKFLILGDGNNILFRDNFDGVVIKPKFKGKKIIKEDDKNVWIEIYSGEDWEEFVTWAVDNNYQGIENMTMIPSSIGGAVSQNIAAYGQNIMDVVESVETFDLQKKEFKTFTNEECEYGYRSSIFKRKYKSRFLLISAVFKLNKVANELETSYHERASRYGSLEEELRTFAEEPYNIKDVMIAVQNLRTKKLPSVDEYGTCGSVFSNPVVTKEKFFELSKIISELQSYPIDKLQYTRKDWFNVNEEYVKIPAGRIIDQLGWLGKWEGDVGVYDKHALCVVTNRKASGKEVFDFLEKIRQNVKESYDIDLDYEINII